MFNKKEIKIIELKNEIARLKMKVSELESKDIDNCINLSLMQSKEHGYIEKISRLNDEVFDLEIKLKNKENQLDQSKKETLNYLHSYGLHMYPLKDFDLFKFIKDREPRIKDDILPAWIFNLLADEDSFTDIKTKRDLLMTHLKHKDWSKAIENINLNSFKCLNKEYYIPLSFNSASDLNIFKLSAHNEDILLVIVLYTYLEMAQKIGINDVHKAHDLLDLQYWYTGVKPMVKAVYGKGL